MVTDSDHEGDEWREGLEANPAWRRMLTKYGMSDTGTLDQRAKAMLEEMFLVLHVRDNYDDPADVEDSILDADSKRRDLHDYLAQGGSWAKAHDTLGLSLVTQVRLLFNNHPSPVFGWVPETLTDFEQDVRAGMGEVKLGRRYRLSPSQARKLIAVFRGMV